MRASLPHGRTGRQPVSWDGALFLGELLAGLGVAGVVGAALGATLARRR